MSIPNGTRRAGLLATMLLAACSTAPEAAETSKPLKAVLGDTPPEYLQERAAIGNAIQTFYKNNGYKPVWFDEAHSNQAFAELLETLRNATSHGLVPADYVPDQLATKRAEITDGDEVSLERLARTDIRLSFAFMDYAGDLHAGHTDPEKVDPRWYTDLQHADYAAELKEALSGSVADTLADLPPSHGGYDDLREGLITYRGHVDNGGWPTIKDGKVLEVGDSSPRVATLRKRLAVTGELLHKSVEKAGVAKSESRTDPVSGPADKTEQKVTPPTMAVFTSGKTCTATTGHSRRRCAPPTDWQPLS